MTIQTKITESIEVPMTADMRTAFNITMPTSGDEKAGPARSTFDLDNGSKVGAILHSVLTLSAAQFPLMTMGAWSKVLQVTQYFDPEERLRMMEASLLPDDTHPLLSKIFDEYADIEICADEVERFKALLPVEVFAIHLVSDQFWSGEHEAGDKLRSILSDVSKRPRESVFSNDPDIEDLWKIRDVAVQDEHTVHVGYDYCGSPMASLKFKFSNDTSSCEIVEFNCVEDRTLSPPFRDLKSFLFGLALEKVFDALPTN